MHQEKQKQRKEQRPQEKVGQKHEEATRDERDCRALG
jgi:hypothetical protein